MESIQKYLTQSSWFHQTSRMMKAIASIQWQRVQSDSFVSRYHNWTAEQFVWLVCNLESGYSYSICQKEYVNSKPVLLIASCLCSNWFGSPAKVQWCKDFTVILNTCSEYGKCSLSEKLRRYHTLQAVVSAWYTSWHSIPVSSYTDL